MHDVPAVTEGYCGLSCKRCVQRAVIPQKAADLQSAMKDAGYEYYGPVFEGFDAFWTFLGNIIAPDGCCKGCRTGGGDPRCAIRLCAEERGEDFCASCALYPCEKLRKLMEDHAVLAEDNAVFMKDGLDAWREHQRKNRAILYDA